MDPDLPRTLQNVLPSEPGSFHPPPQPQDDAPLPSPDPTPVLDALRGIIVTRADATPKQEGNLAISAASLGLSSEERADLNALLAPYLNRPASLETFSKLESAVTRWYRGRGHAFVSVAVPPQRIHNGMLTITVLEYKIGKIDVIGNRWFAAWQIRARSALKSGDIPTLQSLQGDLTWANANPFFTVDTLFRPGKTVGTTDVALDVSDRFPVYAFAAYNNQSDPTTGRLNWNLGVTWGNAFALGQTVSYQYTRADSGRSTSHLGSWSIPLLSLRDQVLIFGTYSSTAPIAPPPYTNAGVSSQISIRYEHNLPHIVLGSGFGIDGLLRLGFDWKETMSDQYKNGHPIVLATADTTQFVVDYTGSLQDPLGKTEIHNILAYGPGGLIGHTSAYAYDMIVPHAKPDYVYDRLTLTRTISLPAGFSSTTTLTGQLATHNLLYSEQLEAGGIGTVRGYYVNTSFGSEGAQVSEEVHAQPLSIAKTLNLGAGFADKETLGVFWDWAENSQRRAAEGFGNKTGLASVGIDLNSTINRVTNINFDMGYRLRALPGSHEHGNFCDFAVVMGF
ncbi:ShlB/FhaC/HecB family hemolysin secretion/activation protein [Neokomagataea tanensis]|nr:MULTISPECIES: ShlB/FhaC/HecB family hemolysin secretion/activation protein [Neokomagataea]